MVIVDNATVRVDAEYTEPTVDVDGGPIEDLAFTTIHYRINGGVTEVAQDVLASSPTGGGVIQTSLLLPIAKGFKAVVDFWITATDTAGLEGPATQVETLTIDRVVVNVAPGAPTSFTVA